MICIIFLTLFFTASVLGNIPPPAGDDLSVYCSNCVWSRHIGYANFPDDCSKYIVCKRKENFDDGYDTWLLYCPVGTYWSHDLLTCSEDIPPYDKCTVVPNDHTIPTPIGCELSEGPTIYEYYYQGELRRCPPPTVFVPKQCACLDPKPEECGDLVLWVPYEADFNGRSCNKAQGDVKNTVILASDSAVGAGAAYFIGNGFIHYPLLSNFYTFKNIKAWTIVLNIKAPQANSVQGILTQADTYKSLSPCPTPFEIHIEADPLDPSKNVIHGKIFTDNGNALVYASVNINVYSQIALRYNGVSTELLVNGVVVATSFNAKGGLINSKCPLIVGWKGKIKTDGMYIGFIDDLRIYSAVLSNAQISAL